MLEFKAYYNEGGVTISAYYNEHDKFAAECLRQLIKAGHIADGVVDERSIVDVQAEEIREFTQCHWFAGIGTWSYALRCAGWSDSRPVWTGSPPCQPFSNAGQRKGKDDDRHLAPHWLELVTECGPPVVFGEQVEAAIRHGWFDDLQAHLEAENYAVGMVVLPACGIGAPHIRQRQWIVAERLGNTSAEGLQVPECTTLEGKGRREAGGAAEQPSTALGGVAYADSEPGQQDTRSAPCNEAAHGREGRDGGEQDGNNGYTGDGENCRVAKPGNNGRNQARGRQPEAGHDGVIGNGCVLEGESTTGPTNGFWRAPDWLYCRDGKWRPVESIHVKMVNGTTGCVGYLCNKNTSKTQEEKVNGCLSCVWKRTCPETVQQRSAGMSVDAEPAEILQQDVHGEGATERAVQQRRSQQEQINEKDAEVLRGLREHWQAACSSPRWRSAEQCRLELDDVVCLLSRSRPLAELRHDRATSTGLQTLFEAICEAGAVQYTPDQVQAIWASLGEEAKNRLRMGFDASRWRFVVPFPLEHGAINRVGRLRGYGNGIVAPLAQAFIETYMSI